MPLCLQADVEKIGQVDFTAEPEPAVTLWIAAATTAIEQFCGRLFEETAATSETVDGSGQTTIRVAGYPVTAVNTVTEDGTALVEGDDYFWYTDGRIIRSVSGQYDRPWIPYRQSIIINYDYGWNTTTVPDDLRTVCANIVLRIFRAGEGWANSPAGAAGNLASLTLEGSGSASWETGDGNTVAIGNVPLLSGVDRDILNRYRRRI